MRKHITTIGIIPKRQIRYP